MTELRVAGALEAGLAAERITRELWPDLRPVPRAADGGGCDARTDAGLLVQIKADLGADRHGRVFWELAKRCDGTWNAYGASARAAHWKTTPSNAHEYVFVSEQYAYRTEVGALIAAVAVGRLVPEFNRRDTSWRWCVPLALLKPLVTVRHGYRLRREAA